MAQPESTALQLVVDVGNTETAMGVARGREVVAHWRVSTLTPRTQDEYALLLRGLLEANDVARDQLERAVVASVVPSASEVLGSALSTVVDGPTITVRPDSDLPIRLDVIEPMTVGADRIVNTLAAKELYGRDTVAVDLGTATTFDIITADGVFMGGVIAPGVSSGLEWLGRRTAKLPSVTFERPERCIGRRTEACIQSGVFYSVVESVDGIVRRILEEWGRPEALVVATGGYATVVAQFCAAVDQVEPLLTLRGLAMAGEFLA